MGALPFNAALSPHDLAHLPSGRPCRAKLGHSNVLLFRRLGFSLGIYSLLDIILM